MDDLELAFENAKNAGCTDTSMFKQVEDLLESIKKVMSEFKDADQHADAIIYKIWDLGGQKVYFLSKTIGTCQL